MLPRIWRAQVILAALVALLVQQPVCRADDEAAGLTLFEERIRPVLVEHCYECHSAAGKTRGGLRLDTREGWRDGGDSGAAILPENPEESLLLEALRSDGTLKMPPKGRLPQHVVDNFASWIRMGAPDPRSSEEKPSHKPHTNSVAAGRNHWAYTPPHRQAIPVVRDEAWPATEIDRFVLSRLEATGLRPVSDANPETLLRRIYFDLLGLPPSAAQIDEFFADTSTDTWERLVDRLLAAPEFGERWGRHWLDVARFGESVTLPGSILTGAWRYRDYVIDAFNHDLPYDQFLAEQLAGDLLPAETREERTRLLVASSVLMLGNTSLVEQDKRQLEMDVIDDQLDLIGKGILAQTLTCARCHDHKFDPIPTRDYYALAGILRNATTLIHQEVLSKCVEVPLPLAPEEEDVFAAQDREFADLEKAIREAQQERKRLSRPATAEAGTSAGDPSLGSGPDDSTSRRIEELQELAKRLETELKDKRDKSPSRPVIVSITEKSAPSDLYVHIRGDVNNHGPIVPRGFLQVATCSAPPAIPENEGGRRQLAEWITRPDNPLTARVLVNRVWHWLFGAGLVRTTDNFGTTGEAPSHPELLDHLAQTFVADGWSMKRLIRSFVLSRTYRLAVVDEPKSAELDPENRLLWRAHRKRLDAECLRDAMLLASGSLSRERGGPGFPASLKGDSGYVDAGTRRSVYVPLFRNALPELFEVFDFADPSTVTGQRAVSTVATQALFLMNHPFVLEQSQRLARQLLAQDLSDTRRLEHVYLTILGRPPLADELAIALRFLDSHASEQATSKASRLNTWSHLIQGLFATAEFRYVE